MNSLVQRVINILKTPRTEWPVIAAEPATIKSLYIPYALILAAIGPVALLIGGGGMSRLTGGFALTAAIWLYCIALLGVAVIAVIINVLAPTFASQKDLVQAFKTAIYAYTASWIAGIGNLLGILGTLIALAGAIYSLYLLYLALPHTMKTPPEKATSYTVVIVVVAILLSLVLGAIGSAVVVGNRGALGMFGAAMSPRDEQVLDPDSPLGRLEKMGRDMERAGSGGAVEALPSDTLKGFIPDNLAGLARQSVSAEKNAMLGVQVSNAKARYGEGARELELEITDSGGAAGLMALAGWANIEQSSENGTRTERTGREGGRMVHEEWDSATHSGEYAVVLGNRFVVKVNGEADSLADLKSAMGGVDLGRLESLRNEGKAQ